MNSVSRNYDLGPDFSDGPQGPDLSLLAHCLWVAEGGWGVEFGVGSGKTLRMIAEFMPVIGFDSFAGLPEDWRPGFPKGAFAQPPPVGIPGATLVTGLFDATVPNYPWPDRLALVHMDADLYSSTATCLASIGPSLRTGTIIVFDEFHGYDDDYHSNGAGYPTGEAQAWWEYVERSGVTWDVIGHGREQWAVRIK